MRFVIIVSAIVVLAACSKGEKAAPAVDPHQATCEHYAKLFRDCHKDEGNPALAQETAQNLCLKGMSGKYEDMFGARYRAMIECTKTATTCEALEKCNESE
jgi:hypothetical protein